MFLVVEFMLQHISEALKREVGIIPVSKHRLMKHLDELARIGSNGEEGITRLAFTREDLQARERVINWAEEMGLDVRIDDISNVFARRKGSRAYPVVMVGSHIDSVTNGGSFDGSVGVVAAMEVIRALEEDGINTDLPVELVVFACEESSRFGCSLVGSKYLTGCLKKEELARYVDNNGVSILDALAGCKFNKKYCLSNGVFEKEKIKAFIELHIEQFDTLKEKGLPIGIVDTIAAPTRFRITVKGVSSHSGATPMFARRDALTAASELVLAIEGLGRAEAEKHTVATVGKIEVKPGNVNVVPGNTTMLVDIRGVDYNSKHRVLKGMEDFIAFLTKERKGISIELETLSDEQPVNMAPEIIRLAQETCSKMKVEFQVMYSFAGHDAMAMAKAVPTGLILIRNVSGISHSPKEWVDSEDIYTGTRVLYEMVKQLALL